MDSSFMNIPLIKYSAQHIKKSSKENGDSKYDERNGNASDTQKSAGISPENIYNHPNPPPKIKITNITLFRRPFFETQKF